MDENSLTQLTEDQLAALNDDLKAVFCALDQKDQGFFAKTFSAKDLPVALTRKAEIMRRDQASRERIAKFKTALAEVPSAPQDKSGDFLAAAAGAIGIGAAAAAVATDNRASWRGARPDDFIAPLRAEFQTNQTRLDVTRNSDTLAATVLIAAENQWAPAMTITLSEVNDTTEVKVGDLTSHSTIEMLKSGGEALLKIAGQAAKVMMRNKGGLPLGDLISTAGTTLDQGAELAQLSGNLKLKDRAWKVIKQTGEFVEANYLSELEKARTAQYALEKAWDDYNNCPTCGVAFLEGQPTCRVCNTPRPPAPVKPDPRRK